MTYFAQESNTLKDSGSSCSSGSGVAVTVVVAVAVAVAVEVVVVVVVVAVAVAVVVVVAVAVAVAVTVAVVLLVVAALWDSILFLPEKWKREEGRRAHFQHSHWQPNLAPYLCHCEQATW